MNKRFLLIIEIVWIITGILCFAVAVRNIIITGDKRTYIFVLLGVISFIFAWLRYRQRKNS